MTCRQENSSKSEKLSTKVQKNEGVLKWNKILTGFDVHPGNLLSYRQKETLPFINT